MARLGVQSELGCVHRDPFVQIVAVVGLGGI
jgi:hypothetical protein